jgi:type VI secretion system protein ImpL
MSALGSLVQGIELPLFILFALLAVGLGIYLAIQFIRHRRAQKADEAVAHAEKEEHAAHDEVAESGEPILSPRLMRSSVRHGFAAYREHVAGSRNPYLVPWFLAAGVAESGVSSLAAAVETHRPPAETPDPVSGKAVGTVWRYHDQAVVIEVGGEAFGRADGGRTPDAAWVALLDELVARRAQQPIDGIILALPITDLYGPTALMPHVLADKASRIYAKLWQAQKVTGLCLPVWVVLTKCDMLPGFRDLVDVLPESRRGDILGWSSPYPLESSFRPDWVDEALGAVEDGLITAGLELSAEGMRPPASSGLFQLPSELAALRMPLANALGIIFRRTAYQEALYFRGVYFTGAAEPMAESLDGTHTLRPEIPGAVPLAFARDLFERKIFLERDLTKSTPRWSASFNRKQRLWAAAAVTCCVLALLFLWQGVVRVNDLSTDFLPSLQQLAAPLRASRDLERDPQNTGAANQANAAQMIRIASRIDGSWSEPLFPAAWFDTLGERVKVALAIGHWRLMMGDIRLHLDQRAQSIVAGDVTVPPTAGAQLPELARLRTFVGDALLLERFTNVYNRLVNTEDVTGLTELLRYTHGLELPPAYLDLARQIEFYQQPSPRQLRGATIDWGSRTYDLAPLRQPLAQEIDQLADAYFKKLAANGDALSRLRTVTSEINQLAGSGSAVLPPTALDTLQRDLNETATTLSAQDGTWLAGGDDRTFGGAAFQTLLKVVTDSPLFGPSTRDRLLALGRTDLGRSIADVRLADSAIGPVAYGVAERSRVELTPTAEGVRTSLRNLMGRPFMAAAAAPVDLNTLGRTGPVRWDLGGLERAVALAENFSLFVGSDLPSFPAPIQAGVRAVAQQRLTNAVVAAVVRSVTPGQTAQGRLEADLRSQIQSNVSAYPLLTKLVQTLRLNGGQVAADRLMNVAALQATVLLGQLDTMLEGEQLYVPGMTAPAAWTKDKIDVAALYGQPDMGGVSALLDRNRQRVSGIATELAQPLLTFLARPDIGSAGGEGIVGRWNRTMQELDKASQGRANGSIGTLENFITTALPDLTPSTCAKLADSQGLSGANFFSDQLRLVRAGVHQQCVAAEDARIATQYRVVERSFTDLLAGRYPFALFDAANSGDFATTDDVANFYKAFDPISDSLLDALHDREAEGVTMRTPTEFIEVMKKGRAFLKPIVGLDDTAEAGATIEPHFRTLTNHERGGEEIIQWQLSVRDDVIDQTMTGKTLTWHPRDPITVSFRWASNAPRVPVGILGRGQIQLSGRTVSITYDNIWSLIALLQQHRPRPGEWRPGPGRPPEVIAFDIPTGRADGKPGTETAARVFIDLAIRALPGPDGKVSGERLGIPDFPLRAPALPASVRIGSVPLGTPASALFGTQ